MTIDPIPKLTKTQRAQRANDLLETIASCGRKFFAYPDQHGISRFEVDAHNRIWFIDGYTGMRLYLHKFWGRDFSEGGALRGIINLLKRFITNGEHMPSSHFGPWPKWLCNGDVWGYGSDMQIIRDKARELGIIREATE